MGNEKNKKSQMNLCDLADMLDHSAKKVAFLREFFCHNVPDDELFCKDARTGFHFIMDDLQDDLEFVFDRLYKMLPTDSVQKKATQ